MTEKGVARKSRTGYEVIFERHISYRPTRLWAMLTKAEHIGTWFCARVEIEDGVGGKIVEHHDHVGVDVFGIITRWEPPRIFEHTWSFDDSPVPTGTVCWTIFPENSGTRLVLTHWRRNLDPGAMAGAHINLEVLCAVLDGADPQAHAAPEGEFRDGAFLETRPGRGRWADREALEQEYKRDFGAL